MSRPTGEHTDNAKDELREALEDIDDSRVQRGLNHVLRDLSHIQGDRRRRRRSR